MATRCIKCCSSTGDPLQCGHRLCEKCITKKPGCAVQCSVCYISQGYLLLDPKKWLAKELLQHRFIVLVFYRGAWRGFCEKALKEMNEIINDVRGLGGDIFGVSSQTKEWADHVKTQWNLSFQVLSDQKNILAKKYNIRMTKKHGNLYNRIIKLAKSFQVNTEQLEDPYAYTHGLTEPGIVVLKRDGSVLYSWRGEPLPKNMLGATDRVSAKTLLATLSFYFQCEDELDSISSYVKTNAVEMYNTIILDSRIRPHFLEHLRKEYNLDLLNFVESVDRLEDKIKWNLNNPVRTFDVIRARNELVAIYITYIIDGAPHQVPLPNDIRSELNSFFIPERLEDRGYVLRQRYIMPIFAAAYRHIKKILREECLPRFIITPVFTHFGPEIISIINDKYKMQFFNYETGTLHDK
jgi:peroxiredoxin